MLLAGLTGSIATGKSTVSSIFRTLGAFVVDADVAAREAVAPGMKAYREIVRVFGRGILLNNGEIDRESLGRIIFNDASKRGTLEEIVHPEVMKAMDDMVDRLRESSTDAVVILDVPLLIETGMHRGLSEVIVVYCPEDIQVMRLIQRDRISSEEALQRIRSQLSIEEKKLYASLLIDNSQSRDDTRKQVEWAFERFREKAASERG